MPIARKSILKVPAARRQGPFSPNTGDSQEESPRDGSTEGTATGSWFGNWFKAGQWKARRSVEEQPAARRSVGGQPSARRASLKSRDRHSLSPDHRFGAKRSRVERVHFADEEKSVEKEVENTEARFTSGPPPSVDGSNHQPAAALPPVHETEALPSRSSLHSAGGASPHRHHHVSFAEEEAAPSVPTPSVERSFGLPKASEAAGKKEVPPLTTVDLIRAAFLRHKEKPKGSVVKPVPKRYSVLPDPSSAFGIVGSRHQMPVDEKADNEEPEPAPVAPEHEKALSPPRKARTSLLSSPPRSPRPASAQSPTARSNGVSATANGAQASAPTKQSQSSTTLQLPWGGITVPLPPFSQLGGEGQPQYALVYVPTGGETASQVSHGARTTPDKATIPQAAVSPLDHGDDVDSLSKGTRRSISLQPLRSRSRKHASLNLSRRERRPFDFLVRPTESTGLFTPSSYSTTRPLQTEPRQRIPLVLGSRYGNPDMSKMLQQQRKVKKSALIVNSAVQASKRQKIERGQEDDNAPERLAARIMRAIDRFTAPIEFVEEQENDGNEVEEDEAPSQQGGRGAQESKSAWSWDTPAVSQKPTKTSSNVEEGWGWGASESGSSSGGKKADASEEFGGSATKAPESRGAGATKESTSWGWGSSESSSVGKSNFGFGASEKPSASEPTSTSWGWGADNTAASEPSTAAASSGWGSTQEDADKEDAEDIDTGSGSAWGNVTTRKTPRKAAWDESFGGEDEDEDDSKDAGWGSAPAGGDEAEEEGADNEVDYDGDDHDDGDDQAEDEDGEGMGQDDEGGDDVEGGWRNTSDADDEDQGQDNDGEDEDAYAEDQFEDEEGEGNADDWAVNDSAKSAGWGWGTAESTEGAGWGTGAAGAGWGSGGGSSWESPAAETAAASGSDAQDDKDEEKPTSGEASGWGWNSQPSTEPTTSSASSYAFPSPALVVPPTPAAEAATVTERRYDFPAPTVTVQ